MLRYLLFSLLLTAQLMGGPTIDLTNTSGVSFEAEILALTDEETTVRRTSDQRVFVLPLTTLNESTRKLLQSNADLITNHHPDYEFNVVIGKRRKKDGSYMVDQTLTCKVDVKNLSRELDSPGYKLRVLLIGQDQKDNSKYKILTAQDFTGAPAKVETETATLEPITTRYDSDNEGSGNLGGYKYEDYILILTCQEGKLISTKTLNSNFATGLTSQPGIIEKLLKAKADTPLDKNLKLGKG